MKRRHHRFGKVGWLLVTLLSVGQAHAQTASKGTSGVTAQGSGTATTGAGATTGSGGAGVGTGGKAHSGSDGSTAEEHEAAQRLAEAQVLALESKWDQARLVFLQAYAIHPTSVVLWDLAVAEIKSDHSLDAAQHLQQYRKHPNAEPAKLARLKEYLQRVHARLGRIQIDAPDATSLTVDGSRMDWSVDEAVVLAPGEHDVVLTYGDQRQAQHVQLPAGLVTTLTLRATPPPPEPNATTPSSSVLDRMPYPDPGLSAETPRSSGNLRTVTLIAGGSLTLASAVVGTVFTLKAASSSTNANDIGRTLGPATCTEASARCDALAKANDDTQAAHRVAGVGYVAAGVFGAATVATLLIWRTPRRNSVGMRVGPTEVWLAGQF